MSSLYLRLELGAWHTTKKAIEAWNEAARIVREAKEEDNA